MLDLSYKAEIRRYFPGKISLKSPVKLENKQVHYLINVMRKKIDDSILVFNSVNGEFSAKISEIGWMCGFQDPNYFARWFRKKTGQTPSQWRALYILKTKT